MFQFRFKCCFPWRRSKCVWICVLDNNIFLLLFLLHGHTQRKYFIFLFCLVFFLLSFLKLIKHDLMTFRVFCLFIHLFVYSFICLLVFEFLSMTHNSVFAWEYFTRTHTQTRLCAAPTYLNKHTSKPNILWLFKHLKHAGFNSEVYTHINKKK